MVNETALLAPDDWPGDEVVCAEILNGATAQKLVKEYGGSQDFWHAVLRGDLHPDAVRLANFMRQEMRRAVRDQTVGIVHETMSVLRSIIRFGDTKEKMQVAQMILKYCNEPAEQQRSDLHVNVNVDSIREILEQDMQRPVARITSVARKPAALPVAENEDSV